MIEVLFKNKSCFSCITAENNVHLGDDNGDDRYVQDVSQHYPDSEPTSLSS